MIDDNFDGLYNNLYMLTLFPISNIMQVVSRNRLIIDCPSLIGIIMLQDQQDSKEVINRHR